MPTLALIPLLVSAVGSYIASEGAKKNERGRMLLGLGTNLTLAIVFLVMRYFWWSEWTFTWYKDAYRLVKGGGFEPNENEGSWISRAFKKVGLG